jgi:hypothetical protein
MVDREAKLFEMLGRKESVILAQDDAYSALLNLTAKIISGEIDRSRVSINLADRSWIVAPQAAKPTVPAPLHGVPDLTLTSLG